MTLKSKIGAFIATAAVACAISAAPAQASTPLPTSGDLSALCAKATNPNVQSVCTKAVATYETCKQETSRKAFVTCLVTSAKGIVKSGIANSNVTIPAGILAKLKAIASGNLSGLNLGNLSGLNLGSLNLGSLNIGGINLSTILNQLGGTGGLNLSGLLAKLGG